MCPQVFADIIAAKGWEEFTLIYEGAELLPFIDSILALQDLETEKDVLKTIVQLPDDGDYRLTLYSLIFILIYFHFYEIFVTVGLQQAMPWLRSWKRDGCRWCRNGLLSEPWGGLGPGRISAVMMMMII